MANTFPTSLPQEIGSSDDGIDDLALDRAANGDLHGRAMYPAKKQTFDVHTYMTAAERATLDAFYDANRTDPFNFTYKATNVTVLGLFDGMPKYRYVSAANGGYFETTYRVVQA